MKATLGGITANQWWIHAPACIYISYYYPIRLIKRIDPDSDRIPNFEHRIYSYVSIHSKISRFNINAFIKKKQLSGSGFSGFRGKKDYCWHVRILSGLNGCFRTRQTGCFL